MTPQGRLGRCPRCGASITEAWVILEYQTDTGWKVYAECPGEHLSGLPSASVVVLLPDGTHEPRIYARPARIKGNGTEGGDRPRAE